MAWEPLVGQDLDKYQLLNTLYGNNRCLSWQLRGTETNGVSTMHTFMLKQAVHMANTVL